MNVIAHVKGFSSSAGLVEKRSIAVFEIGQFLDHSLIVDQRFESALGNLGLIGGVGSVPAWVLEQISEDDWGG